MWPFAKKEPKPKKPKPKKPEIKPTGPPYAIGDRFQYLGVEMVCCRDLIWPWEFRVVVGQYVTKNGEIKEEVFWPCDFDLLESERVRSLNKKHEKDNV